jgi:hypothetical protein
MEEARSLFWTRSYVDSDSRLREYYSPKAVRQKERPLFVKAVVIGSDFRNG